MGIKFIRPVVEVEEVPEPQSKKENKRSSKKTTENGEIKLTAEQMKLCREFETEHRHILAKEISGIDLLRISDIEFKRFVRVMKYLQMDDDFPLEQYFPPEEEKPRTYQERVESFIEIYKHGGGVDSHKPICVSCSHGKDSTVVASIVANALLQIPPEERTRKVYILSSDTRVEIPQMEQHVEKQTRLINEWAKENNIPLQAEVVMRPDKHGIFYLLIGKGYPLPTNSNRWCTHKLKIEPQEIALMEYGANINFVGTRLSESKKRKASVKKYHLSGDISFSSHNEELRMVPIIKDMEVDEVWRILSTPLPWGSAHDHRILYKEASGECPIFSTDLDDDEDDTPGCGVRFGCWICMVVKSDKSTENMSLTHEWMEELVNFRAYLIEEWNKSENRSGYQRNGTQLGDGQGCIKIEARKRAFELLLETERRASEGAGQEIRLLSETEKEMIVKQWEEDQNERPYLS